MDYLGYFMSICCVLSFIGNAAARSKGGKMPDKPIKLYYLPPSPPCRSVMMTARVLGLELELVMTNILVGDHMTPEFHKMNPQHTIPTMDDNGFVLFERYRDVVAQYGKAMDAGGSAPAFVEILDGGLCPAVDVFRLRCRAIMAYLVNAYGRDDTLYPKNPRQRAIVDQRLYFDVGTLFNRYLKLYLPILFHGEEYNEENAQKLHEALGFLDKFLDGRAFVAGDNLTIADISIVVTLTNLDAFEFDISSHENVVKWFERTKNALEPYGYQDIDAAGAQILASFLKKE